MISDIDVILIIGIAVAVIATLWLWLNTSKERDCLKKREQELKQEVLKASILRELTKRIGYTFDVHQIIEVISGSLREVVEYQTVSYLLIDEEKQTLSMKIDLNNSVGETFINTIKDNMINGLSALCDKSLSNLPMEETIVGAIPLESQQSVASYFNLPLVIGGQAVGLINVASTKQGLYQGTETEILYSITSLASDAVHRLSEVIEREQRRLNSLVRSLPGGLVMIGLDERVRVANEGIKNLLGFKEDEKIYLPELAKRIGSHIDIYRMIESALKMKEISTVEEIAIGSNTYHLTIYPVTDTTNEAFGSAIVLRDVSAQKALTKMREEYTAMMVHELRSPLTNIRWAVEAVLAEAKPTKKKIQEPLEQVETSTLGLLTLVNDLLDAAKIEQGKMIITKDKGDLAEIIQTKIKDFEATAQKKKLKLSAIIPEHLPQCSFDKTRIGQVLNNFLSNAIKFTSEGSVTIRVTNENTHHTIRVAVEDTGQGITDEDQKKLFQKFAQVGSPESKHKGTGLGLVISKGIIEAHGGQVGADSVPDKGSTFWFEIPNE